jgi:hypothetical protein
MKTYKERALAAKKAKTARSLTPSYLEWKEKGQEMVGMFISKAEISSSVGGGTYNQYLFETDEGNVKFHLGHAADTEVAEVFTQGLVYSITFQGQEDIGGGKRVNKFDILELGPVGEV